MSGYKDHMSEHRRLTILRHLEQSPGYVSNASILVDVANGVGVGSTWDQVRTEIAWLTDQGLVTSEEVAGFVTATATRAGVEVATGKRTAPGVRRPSARG